MRTVFRLTMALAAIISLAACDYFDYDPLANPTVTIAWVSPAANAFIDGNVTFNVATTGPVERVDFLIDGHEVDSTTTGSTTIDMANEAPGYVTVSARAVTTDGFEEVVHRRFRIAGEAPMLDWVEPESQDTFVPHQRIDMHVEASDMSGTLTSVVFKIGNDIVERFDDIDDMNVSEPTSFEYRYEGFEVVAGNVTLSAVATNEKGLTTTVTRNIVIVPPAPDFIDRERPDVWWDESTIRNGEVVSSSVDVLVRGEDNVRIAFFDFFINGAWVDRKVATYEVGTIDPNAYAEWTWDTLGGDLEYPDGSYLIEAIAEDTSGNRSSAARATVQVDNGLNGDIPEVNWLFNDTFYENATVTSAIDMSFVLGDGFLDYADVAGFRLYIDDVLVFTEFVDDAHSVTATPAGLSPADSDPWFTGDILFCNEATGPIDFGIACFFDSVVLDGLPDGLHEFKLVAFDYFGNYSAPATVTLNIDFVDDEAPVVLWYEGTANDKVVSGSDVILIGVGADNVSITDFEFYINDYLTVVRDTNASPSPASPEFPYQFIYTWSLTGIDNGDYELKLIGRDAAGNRSEPAIVTITVSNTNQPF